jgi:hypothetical protein
VPQTITGRCLCGGVRYEYAGRLSEPVWCHCESCRRASGAPAVAWVTMALAQFRYTHGAPHQFASSPKVVRTFCPGCGTPLTYQREGAGEDIDVTIASFDEPSSVQPAEHVWMRDAIAWDRPHDGLPQHPMGRRDA